ncbi:MAG: Fe-only/vanadium nitrogenase subunit delta [Peptococcaceae bacterium]|jgi:nitrogenase delta subunit|nr:Fe-only/vanadium nitrogenase subunit delta [Peptococcaceae bacterium]
MEEKVDAVYGFVMERCLWQFFSRNWDREANIKNIMGNVAKLQSAQEADRATNQTNAYYADAKILTEQLSKKFPWFVSLSLEEISTIRDQVIDRLMDVAVVHSLNAERTEINY